MSKTDTTTAPVEGGRIIGRRRSLGQFHDQVTVAIFNMEGYSLHQFKHLFTVAITNQVGYVYSHFHAQINLAVREGRIVHLNGRQRVFLTYFYLTDSRQRYMDSKQNIKIPDRSLL